MLDLDNKVLSQNPGTIHRTRTWGPAWCWATRNSSLEIKWAPNNSMWNCGCQAASRAMALHQAQGRAACRRLLRLGYSCCSAQHAPSLLDSFPESSCASRASARSSDLLFKRLISPPPLVSPWGLLPPAHRRGSYPPLTLTQSPVFPLVTTAALSLVTNVLLGSYSTLLLPLNPVISQFKSFDIF